MSTPKQTYKNAGNPAVVARVPSSAQRVLDVGCGAGDNARLLRARGHQVWGITLSEDEAALARENMVDVWVGNAEDIVLPVSIEFFDVLFMSHVLEHFADPALVLERLAPYLRRGGLLVAAVPNMAHWRTRARIVGGNWERTDSGPFDRTHLQFWSVHTAPGLFAGTPFELASADGASPSVPLRPLRRISAALATRMDDVLGGMLPNLFAQQVILTARRRY